MKTLRRISALTLLSLTLSICVLAGQTDTPGKPEPTHSQAVTTTETTQTTETTEITTTILLAVLDLIYR